MRILIAVAGVLLCATLYGQEPPEDEPVLSEEEMFEACPELKTAGPREHKQLVALFFTLGSETLKREAAKDVRDLFDLKSEADTAILIRYLDKPGRSACGIGLRAVFRAHAAPGQLWLLERYVKAEPAKRGRLIGMLASFDDQETWLLLLKLLDDRTPVPSDRAAETAPQGYVHLRVCDYALRALGSKLSRLRRIRIKRTNRHVHPTLPLEDRDFRIKTVRQLLERNDEFQTHLLGLPRLGDALDVEGKEQAIKALAKLGVKTR